MNRCPYCGCLVPMHAGGATTVQYVCQSCWYRVVVPSMQAMAHHRRRSGPCEAVTAPETLKDE